MAVQTITYDDKQYLNQNIDIPATNKVQDTDMNEIKSVVNNNANELINLQAIELFNGSTIGTATLSDSAENYSYLEIFFEGANNFSSVKVFEPNNKNVYLIVGWLNNNTNGNIKIANVNISGTSITKMNYSAISYSTNSMTTDEENGITIRKVIGYK